jgi:hypothetical protein
VVLQQEIEINHKVVILFSLISQKRTCIQLIAYKDYLLVQLLMQHCIESLCLSEIDNGRQKLIFNGEFLKPYVKGDHNWLNVKDVFEQKALEAYNCCIAKASVCYFMKLLATEYSRNPQHQVIRQLITKLHEDKRFKEIAISRQDSKQKMRELFTIVSEVNCILRDKVQERNLDQQGINLDYIRANFIDVLQREQHGTRESIQSPL